MCGRLNEKISGALWESALKALAVAEVPDPPSDINTPPTSDLPMVTGQDSERRVYSAYWGFLPGSKYSTINARAETLDEKPLYRNAFYERRGIIIADSFYEWDKTVSPSQPYRVLRKDEAPIYLAALFALRQDVPKTTCTIVTTASDGLMHDIHHRMPVLLDLPEAEAWLDPITKMELLHKMIQPHPWIDMRKYSISTLVNNPKNKSEEILHPL